MAAWAVKTRLAVAVAELVRLVADLCAFGLPGDGVGGCSDGRRRQRAIALGWRAAKVLADLSVYLKKAGYLPRSSDGFVGLAGVVGSVAGAVPLVVAAAAKRQ